MKKIVLITCYSFFIHHFLKIIVGVKFAKPTFLKDEKQFILIANHNSHLDTMSILASLPKSVLFKVRPVAAQDHFGKTKWQTWMSNYFINTLLIQRKTDKENPENDPIFKMNKALEDGFSLIIFPEGTRGEPNQSKEFKAGVALLLIKNPKIPYVPIYLKSMGKAMPKGDSLIIPHESAIFYGSVNKISSVNVDEILAQMKKEIEDLKQQCE
ncbi:2-acyl-glycerophospho-ethanolamine acyltransferase [compost metagenome]|jgi:1-acyl-sn-glycerol-3-phosphate acyltransferase